MGNCNDRIVYVLNEQSYELLLDVQPVARRPCLVELFAMKGVLQRRSWASTTVPQRPDQSSGW